MSKMSENNYYNILFGNFGSFECFFRKLSVSGAGTLAWPMVLWFALFETYSPFTGSLNFDVYLNLNKKWKCRSTIHIYQVNSRSMYNLSVLSKIQKNGYTWYVSGYFYLKFSYPFPHKTESYIFVWSNWTSLSWVGRVLTLSTYYVIYILPSKHNCKYTYEQQWNELTWLAVNHLGLT